ncbi:hypothetical protein SAMN04488526_2383 [Jannaschia helgolandensis]|uniref:Restriction endonuclease type II NgoFVII N-terminal domain-containing protein n=1 Tax=Jannaschia helgolandensis TaxID=188906 RepID=A0A1H7P171_9RHOB|nr:hypothetical protein SAMN04488526_2383 [Jannaschia helgolandensis]
MRYLDSSTRNVDQALGHWIENEPTTSVSHLRLQTGYFSINGLSAFGGIIAELVGADLPVSAVVGSNDRDTTKSDVENLISLVGCPRPNARVCIVSYSGGLFHPKVVHLTRADGSQLAYVGSANLTPAGVGAGNIEAGVLLDTNDGDPVAVLDDIASRIDGWFAPSLPAASIIKTRADVQKCLDDGILGLIKPPRKSIAGVGGTSSGPSKPTLSPLKTFAPIASSSPSSAAATSPSSAPTVSAPSAPTYSLGGQDVLVAEIGGGARWKQANFPIAIMQNYFGVNPVANDQIRLHEVAASGAVTNAVDTQVVNVKSQNYRMELLAVAGISYPASGRPIGIFKKIASKEFRYRVFMPGDPAHATLAGYLSAKYAGPSHHLKRVIIDNSELQNLWSACPV